MVRINFTDTDTYGQSSLGRDPLPAGKYHVAITDVETRESGPNAKFPGSEYWSIEFTVQGGDYQGRKVWTNASLLPHALYTLKGVLEAIGYETVGNELDVEQDDLVNQELVIRVIKKGAGQIKNSKGEMQDVDERNEVKGFYKLDDKQAATVSGGAKTLLP